MNRKGKMDGQQVLWLVVIGAAAYFLIFGLPGGSEPETPTTTPTGSTGGCAVEDISFTPKMNQLGLLGTVVSDTNYYIVTDNIGSVAAGTATTVGTNKDLEVYFGENSTTHYTVVEEFNTDCTDPYTMSVPLAKADQSLSIKLFTEDNIKNDAAEPQVIGADEEVEMKLCAKTSADEYFGNPACDENVLIIEFDKTYIQDIEGDAGDADYSTRFFTATNSSNDGDVALSFPVLGEQEEGCITLTMTATSSDPTSAIAKPIMHFYDCDIDKNEDDLSVIVGVEDEDDNGISIAAQTETIYLS